MSDKSGPQGYIHGYNEREQRRLIEQAEVLAPFVYPGVSLGGSHSILEIGSGVGAQTLQLLKRYPHLRVTCLEKSGVQLEAARELLHDLVKRGQVTLVQGSVEELPFENSSFDAVFDCWVLEHLSDSARAIGECARVLKDGGTFLVREVFNQLWFASPRSELLDEHWKRFNETQLRLGGNPYIGIELGHMLRNAGFHAVDIEIRSEAFDGRDQSRKQVILEYWRDLFLSGELVSDELRALISAEFSRLIEDPAGVLFFGFVAGRGVKASAPLGGR